MRSILGKAKLKEKKRNKRVLIRFSEPKSTLENMDFIVMSLQSTASPRDCTTRRSIKNHEPSESLYFRAWTEIS